MYYLHTTLSLIFYLALFVVCSLPVVVFGADTPPTFQPLVGIPRLTDIENASVPDYINALYILTISLAALLGVIKIAIAGVKYTMSDVVTNKASALQDIRGVLFGLALLLIPFIVLQTIYQPLTSLNILQNINPILEPKVPDDESTAQSPSERLQGAVTQCGGIQAVNSQTLECKPPQTTNEEISNLQAGQTLRVCGYDYNELRTRIRAAMAQCGGAGSYTLGEKEGRFSSGGGQCQTITCTGTP